MYLINYYVYFASSRKRYPINFSINFRPHRMYCIRCWLLLQRESSVVGRSVCLCVCACVGHFPKHCKLQRLIDNWDTAWGLSRILVENSKLVFLRARVGHFERKFQGRRPLVRGSSTHVRWRQTTRVTGLSRGVICVIQRLAVLVQYWRVTPVA